MNNIERLYQFVAEIEREFSAIDAERNWNPPPPPPLQPSGGRPILRWKEGAQQHAKATITVEELRTRELPQRLHEYITRPISDPAEFPALLALVPAGGGKTHSAVVAAQWAAAQGMRTLWAAPTHHLFKDLQGLTENGQPIFNPELWYHFHSLRDDAWCKHHTSQKAWSERGYPSRSLCEQLCGFPENWIHQCPYRMQAKRKEKIVFGMHQHLTTGLNLGNFDLAIIDELPLKAFLKERLIPPEYLVVLDGGPLQRVTESLQLLARSCRGSESYSGRRLFEWIGGPLQEVYNTIRVLPERLPEIPIVSSPADVEHQPYFYVFEFLMLALRETKAYQCGWANWAERIRLDSSGLYLLSRNEPWPNLPARLIVLDATAEPHLYGQVFGNYTRPAFDEKSAWGMPPQMVAERATEALEDAQWRPRYFETYKPQIARQGRIFQVCGRHNGKARITKGSKLTGKGEELLGVARQIAGRYNGRVGVICHLAVKPIFEEVFGVENVLHYGDLRGTNSLENADCLIVCGAPGPSPQDVMELATVLDKTRIEPFSYDNMRVLYTEQEHEYLITEELRQEHEGMVPFRLVKGYWNEPELQSIQDQLARAELLQGVFRGRLYSNQCDVWILSAMPIGEPVDGIWDDPPIGPEGIDWRIWLKLEPWLQEQWEAGNIVGARQLAEWVRGSESYIRREGWVWKIHKFMPDRWVLTDDPGYTNARGPRVQALKSITA